MQEVLERPAKPAKAKPEGKKPELVKAATAVTAPRMAVIHLPIRNMPGSPLVVHAFSAKSREQMRAKQEAGSVGGKGRKRDPKNFEDAYNGARHIAVEGWDGINAAAFRNAAIDACRLVGFKMTVGKLSVFAEPDGISKADGTPLVRIHGEPVPFEAIARNQTGVADIRVRPRWDEWSATVRIRFDTDQFTPDDVVNLFLRAGAQVGVGEGRPNSSKSNGLGWGMFEIDQTKPLRLVHLEARRAEFVVE